MPVAIHAETPRDSIYNESANSAEEIASALTVAKQDHKRVLLQFGANWCPWCHKLHRLFDSDPAIKAELAANFVVVMVDVNKGHNNEVDVRYGQPTKQGLPVLVVLDADGTQLTTQETGALESGQGHDPARVLAFLKQWAPPRGDGQPTTAHDSTQS